MKLNIFAKKFFVPLLVLITIPVIAYCAGIPKNKTQDEFVQFSQSALITTHNGSKLMLIKPDSKTLWFTDRPVRKAGWLSTNDFAKGFNKYFLSGADKSDPNASVVGEDANGHRQIIILTLANPSYNKDKNTLVYSISNVSSEKPINKIGKLNKVAVFIDGVCWPWDHGC